MPRPLRRIPVVGDLDEPLVSGGDYSPREYRTTNDGGGAACLTREAFDEYSDAAIHAYETRDTSWMSAVYASGQCIRLETGLRVTIERGGGLGVSQIYV